MNKGTSLTTNPVMFCYAFLKTAKKAIGKFRGGNKNGYLEKKQKGKKHVSDAKLRIRQL